MVVLMVLLMVIIVNDVDGVDDGVDSDDGGVDGDDGEACIATERRSFAFICWSEQAKSNPDYAHFIPKLDEDHDGYVKEGVDDEYDDDDFDASDC